MEISSLKDLVVLKVLGQGSFSTVQLVKKNRSRQTYALKTVKMDKLTSQDKQAALNQIRILASISHSSIISYEGSFYHRQGNSLCILMEYAEQGDLQGIINKCANKNQMKNGLPQQFIWATLVDILRGLQFLHKNNIVHRDIKSANIFYSKGNAKLGDFNVSKISQSKMFSTKTGTPYYTAPQIWKGQLYTQKCDIWSLGCILYEMCTLLPPFRSSNFPELFLHITKGYYEAISIEYSQQLRVLVQMCLQTDPENRPTAGQLLEHKFFEKYTQKRLDSSQQTIIDMLGPLKYPKILKNSNFSLPKPIKSRKQINIIDKKRQNQFRVTKKKTVDFSNCEKQLRQEQSPLNSRKTFIGSSIRIKKNGSKHKTFQVNFENRSPSCSIAIKSQKNIDHNFNPKFLPQIKKNSIFDDQQKVIRSSKIKTQKFRLKTEVKSQKIIQKQNTIYN